MCAEQAWCLPSGWSVWGGGGEGVDICVLRVEMFGDGVGMESWAEISAKAESAAAEPRSRGSHGITCVDDSSALLSFTTRQHPSSSSSFSSSSPLPPPPLPPLTPLPTPTPTPTPSIPRNEQVPRAYPHWSYPRSRRPAPPRAHPARRVPPRPVKDPHLQPQAPGGGCTSIRLLSHCLRPVRSPPLPTCNYTRLTGCLPQ